MICKKCGAEIADVQDKFCQMCGEPIQVAPEVSASAVGVSLESVWPEWKIEELLGRGSYGSVYTAVRRDHNLESRAAIKIISVPVDSAETDALRSEGMSESGIRTYLEGVVDDFVKEIQLMQSLKGVPNIVSVEDYKLVENIDSIGWKIYIRMELLKPFSKYLAERGKLSEEEVIKLGCDICTALEFCGKRNVIHRDIKPDNIFINDFGDFKLGDFGIARTLENSKGGMSQKGTFFYMAPEVSMSSEYDFRVDIYSLGLVLYRLLNENRMPFLETEEQQFSPSARREAVDRRLRGEAMPAPRNASPEMAQIILHACEYSPVWRFSSASEMKDALEELRNASKRSAKVYPAPKIDGMEETVSTRTSPTAGTNPEGTGAYVPPTTGAFSAGTESNTPSSPVAYPTDAGTSTGTPAIGDPSVPSPTPGTWGDVPKKKKTPIIVIALIAAVVVIGAVVALIAANNTNNRGSDPETNDRVYSYGSLKFTAPSGWSVANDGNGSFELTNESGAEMYVSIFSSDSESDLSGNYDSWKSWMNDFDDHQTLVDYYDESSFVIQFYVPKNEDYAESECGFFIKEFIPSYDSKKIIDIACSYYTNQDIEDINFLLDSIAR